ncbi:MAG: acyl CoA:acetate/3-ketoacid CoA transferase [Opitutales bacterium]
MPTKPILNPTEAARLVPDGAWLAIQGSGGGAGEPTALLRAIRERFDTAGTPSGLTLVHATGLGDKQAIGADLLAVEGLVERDIAGHLAMAPQMGRLIQENRVASINFPQGVLSHMYHAVAGRKPGVFTKVGLKTYIDPRLEAGKMNDRAKAEPDRVRVMDIDGEEWLFFPRFHFDAALIRGTTADEHGNITAEQEAAFLEAITIAQAAKACGGKVIAQVKYLAKAGTLDPRNVKIPGVSVDAVVVDPTQRQTCLREYEPALCGAVKMPLERIPPLPLDARKVVARRAARELNPNAIVNLGVGMPDGVASVATEEGIIDTLTFTVEQGLVGGMPAGGVEFGVAYNPSAIIGEDDQFNFYDGGNLDIAFLGMAQLDGSGNVNVSKVGNLLAGCGGFINITQNAKKVVFCGTFTAKGFACTVNDGLLTIQQDGSIRKCVDQVEQITFSGAFAKERQQPVLFITERAVLELRTDGLWLTEIAPGADLDKGILGQMAFEPRIPEDGPALMDPDLFR